MIKYVFFDFNGTILDDVDLCLDLLNEILIKQGKKILNLSEYKEIFTFPVRKYYELAGVDFKQDSFEDLSKFFINKYQPLSFKCSCYPNVKELIKILKEKGIVVGILSASQIDNLKEQLEVLDLKDEFSFVLGLDNIYAVSKENIARDFLLNNKIVPETCLMLGDTLHDYEVAENLGMNSILFSGGHQSKNILKKAKRPIIDDLLELINYI